MYNFTYHSILTVNVWECVYKYNMYVIIALCMGLEYNQNNYKILHTNYTSMHAWVLIAEPCTCLTPKSFSLNPCYCLVFIFIRKSTSFCIRYIIPQTAIQSWIICGRLAYLWRCIVCNGSPWNPVEDNIHNCIWSRRGRLCIYDPYFLYSIILSHLFTLRRAP